MTHLFGRNCIRGVDGIIKLLGSAPSSASATSRSNTLHQGCRRDYQTPRQCTELSQCHLQIQHTAPGVSTRLSNSSVVHRAQPVPPPDPRKIEAPGMAATRLCLSPGKTHIQTGAEFNLAQAPFLFIYSNYPGEYTKAFIPCAFPPLYIISFYLAKCYSAKEYFGLDNLQGCQHDLD